MRPRSPRMWLPLGRLGAFFVAVVVGGNLLLHSIRNPVDRGGVGRRTDFLTRQKKRLRKRWRVIQIFFRRTFGMEPEPEAGVFPAVPRVGFLACLGPDPSLFDPLGPEVRGVPATWPRPIPPSFPLREIDLPFEEHGLVEPILNADLHAEWVRSMRSNFGLEVGDAIVSGPEALLDSIVRTGMKILPRGGQAVREPGEAGPIMDRILDFRMNQRTGSFTQEYMGRLVDREQSYFAKFPDSGLDSFAFQDGRSDIDTDRLLRDQGKLAWDALRKTYASKFDFTGERVIRDDAFYFNQWRGLDYLALPPLMAGYFYYRGLDKTFSMAGTELHVGLEPIRLWTRGDSDLVAGLTLEWRIKDWPVALVMTAGRYDGAFEVEFVGIGTSAGMAVQALGISD